MKRIKVLSGILILTMMLSVACGKDAANKEASASKDDAEKVTLTGETAPEEIAEAAEKQYGSEEKRGSSRLTKVGGVESTTTYVFDAEKEMYQDFGEDGQMTQCGVKDGETYYTYVLDQVNNEWLRYEQEADEADGLTRYEYLEEGKALVTDEEDGYSNVTYSNEGEEQFDGVNTVKIKVTSEWIEEVGENKITRESVLSDHELTEEAVGYIDGLSEALDKYVEAWNEAWVTTYETYLWVDVDTHRPVQTEATASMDGQFNSAMKEFTENSWKASSVMMDMEAGLSLEEALKYVEETEKDMKTDDAADGESDETTTKVTYVYGDDCAELGALPESYKEITQEEYESGAYLDEE